MTSLKIRPDKMLEIVPAYLRSWGFEIADQHTRFDGLTKEVSIRPPYDHVLYSLIGLTQACVRYREHGNFGHSIDTTYTVEDVVMSQRLLARVLEAAIPDLSSRYIVTYRVKLPDVFASLLTYSRRGSLMISALINATTMRSGMPAVVHVPLINRYAEMYRGYRNTCPSCGVPAPAIEQATRATCTVCGSDLNLSPSPKIRLSKKGLS